MSQGGGIQESLKAVDKDRSDSRFRSCPLSRSWRCLLCLSRQSRPSRRACVLYPDGSTWDTADPLMYTNMASTTYDNYDTFPNDAVDDMKKKRAGFTMKRMASGKTAGGHPYFINDYPPWRRVQALRARRLCPTAERRRLRRL